MKKFLFFVATIVLVLTASSCQNSSNEPEIITLTDTIFVYGEVYRVPPIPMDETTTMYLDSIFSSSNNLISQSTSTVSDSLALYFVINSKEEFKNINPFDFECDIDFTQYTLIGTRVTFPITNLELYDKALYKNASLSKYRYVVSLHFPLGVTPSYAITHYYFWEVYPKLELNYKTTFEYAVIIVDEEE